MCESDVRFHKTGDCFRGKSDACFHKSSTAEQRTLQYRTGHDRTVQYSIIVHNTQQYSIPCGSTVQCFVNSVKGRTVELTRGLQYMSSWPLTLCPCTWLRHLIGIAVSYGRVSIYLRITVHVHGSLGPVQYRTAQYSTARYGTAQYSTVRYCTVCGFTESGQGLCEHYSVLFWICIFGAVLGPDVEGRMLTLSAPRLVMAPLLPWARAQAYFRGTDCMLTSLASAPGKCDAQYSTIWCSTVR